MEKVNISVSLKEDSGKEAAKKIRIKGNVPAVVYGKDVNVSVELSPENLKALRAIHFSESTIINMEVQNTKKKEKFPVIIKDIQHHPLNENILHIDFLKVSLKEKIRVHIPLVFKGEDNNKNLKEGATLEQVLREVEIEGLPLDLPEKIEIDVSNLAIGHSIHVSDIKLTGNVKFVTQLEETVATVLAKKEEEEEPEEAIVEGEGPQEPEVIKEKKEETEESTSKESDKEKQGEKEKQKE